MALNSHKKKILEKVYRDVNSPGGFTGNVNKLFRAAREKNASITYKDVVDYLSSQRAYTLHKLQPLRFPRRKIIAAAPRIILTCDLADMTLLHSHNGGIKYILLCIDVFSRLMKAVGLVRKNSKSVLSALRNIIESPTFRGISRLHTDRGAEFYNRPLLNYLKKKNIKLYSTFSDTKAAIAERAIRTLKHRIYRYMTLTNSLKYIEVLPAIVETYNSTPHSSLKKGQTPQQVHSLSLPRDIRRQFGLMYLNARPHQPRTSPRLTPGAHVRITSHRGIFHKSYWPQNTEEIFKIQSVDNSQVIPTYSLIDLSGEKILGQFYAQELIETSLPEFFPIKILRRRRKTDGSREYLVSWVGYPRSADSWVHEKDMQNVRQG